jgi:hypothetical protein
VNYDIIHYFKYNEELKKNDFFIHKIKFHWPLPYSYRIQYLVNEKYEGYYFPPLQQKKSRVITSKNDEKKKKIKQLDVNDDSSEDERNDDSEAGDFDDDDEDDTGLIDAVEASRPEDVGNVLKNGKKWTCIYREMKNNSAVDATEGESRKRKSSYHDLRNDPF